MTIIACEVSLHALPLGVSPTTGPLALPTDWATAPWGRTFDDALAALSELPRLYTELDGSFVWTSAPGEDRWQLFGCLYDRGTELAYVDLFGQCRDENLRQLFACARGTVPLMVQSRGGGRFFTEEAFLAGVVG
jgi:hypothetical protein